MKIRLRHYRIRKGFSQKELAKVSGVSEQAISNIEAKGTMPYPGTLKKLADTLGISIEQLLEDEEESRDLQKVS